MAYLDAFNQNPPQLLFPRHRSARMLPTAGEAAPMQGPQNVDSSFLLDDGSGRNTPSSIAMRRRLAQTLMNQGTSTAPVGHWTQALARGVQGGLGGFYAANADEAEATGRRDAMMRLAKALNTRNDGRVSGEATATLLTDPWIEGRGRGSLRNGASSSSATERIIERLMAENPDMSYRDAIGSVRRGPQDDSMERERLAVQALRAGEFGTLEEARKFYALTGGANSAPAPSSIPASPPAPNAIVPPSAPSLGASPGQSDDVLARARDAIARGAPRDAVLQRLRELGVDVPPGL